MRSEQVADGIYRFYDRIVNWYLIDDGGHLTIVDSAFPRSWPAIQRGIASIGRQLGDVRAVLISHGHADHFGAAEDIRTSLGVPVHAHHREVPRINGEHKAGASYALVPKVIPHLWRPSAWVYLVHETKEGFLTPKWVGAVTRVEDGQVLDVPGGPQVIYTPGHTNGHIGFHLPASGVLFSGDELVTTDPLLGRSGPRLMPSALNDDHAKARASLDRLDGLAADLLLPGHGAPWRGPLATAVALARESEEY